MPVITIRDMISLFFRSIADCPGHVALLSTFESVEGLFAVAGLEEATLGDLESGLV